MKQLLERIKHWWNGTPVPVKPERSYSIRGWERGADGVYRKGDSVIYRRGRAWMKVNAGVWGKPDATLVHETFPTLHAAIQGNQPE